MATLAEHLRVQVGAALADCDADTTKAWSAIEVRLNAGATLEEALGSDALPDRLAEGITQHTAELIGRAEAEAFRVILGGPSLPAFGRLFHHILQNNDVADVIDLPPGFGPV
jgi:hypothetical protein